MKTLFFYSVRPRRSPAPAPNPGNMKRTRKHFLCPPPRQSQPETSRFLKVLSWKCSADRELGFTGKNTAIFTHWPTVNLTKPRIRASSGKDLKLFLFAKSSLFGFLDFILHFYYIFKHHSFLLQSILMGIILDFCYFDVSGG